ncbi:MAG: YkgJ family cysteine cluster protein [Myxococcota bacterium]|nr:YkgJ family cysteine cluster protein [Myxococcota bacterium]
MQDELLRNYRNLVARVEAHGARIHDDWSEHLACRSGCSGCCHRTLTVFPVEAAAIREHIVQEGLPEQVAPPDSGPPKVSPLTLLASEDAKPCAFLDGHGHCRIYSARPLLCRSHGLPVAVSEESGMKGDCCPLNFQDLGLAQLPSEDFLNLDATNAVLAAVNLAYARATGVDPSQRVALSDIEAESRVSSPTESPGSA